MTHPTLSAEAVLVLTQLALQAKDNVHKDDLIRKTGLSKDESEAALAELIKHEYAHPAHHGQTGYHLTKNGADLVNGLGAVIS